MRYVKKEKEKTTNREGNISKRKVGVVPYYPLSNNFVDQIKKDWLNFTVINQIP